MSSPTLPARLTSTGAAMALRTIQARIKSNNQTINTRHVMLDPDDDLQVRDALLRALRDLGEKPTPRFAIELYEDDGAYLRKMHAA